MNKGLTQEQILQENASEFKIQMTLFVHDMPEIPVPGAMDIVSFSNATEIIKKLTDTKEWVMNAIQKL